MYILLDKPRQDDDDMGDIADMLCIAFEYCLWAGRRDGGGSYY